MLAHLVEVAVPGEEEQDAGSPVGGIAKWLDQEVVAISIVSLSSYQMTRAIQGVSSRIAYISRPFPSPFST